MITVLPGFNVFSICKVYLELTSLGCFLNTDGQFPGASSGLLDSFLAQGPSKTALKASKDALCGSNNIGDYLYFNSTKRISPEDYSSYKIVGGNCFYKK